MALLIFLIIIFLILIFIYFKYKSIILFDALYWGPGCGAPVKVIDKTLFNVTISTYDGTYNIGIIEFLTTYRKS